MISNKKKDLERDGAVFTDGMIEGVCSAGTNTFHPIPGSNSRPQSFTILVHQELIPMLEETTTAHHLAEVNADTAADLISYLEVLGLQVVTAMIDRTPFKEEVEGIGAVDYEGTITVTARFDAAAAEELTRQFSRSYDYKRPAATDFYDGAEWGPDIMITRDRPFDRFLTRAAERLNKLVIAEGHMHGEGLWETLEDTGFGDFRLLVVGDHTPGMLEAIGRKIINS